MSAGADRQICESVVVDSIPGADDELVASILSASRGRISHDKLYRECGLFDLIEMVPPSTYSELPAREIPLKVGAWNVERCKYVHATAAKIRNSGCDIVLLSELDKGMARSSNRDTIREIAYTLGYGYAFCVEFVEAGMGHQAESVEYADERNQLSLHGNAILSRFPLENCIIIPTISQGLWFDLDWHHRRLGGRRALVADVCVGPDRIRVSSVHFESLFNPAERLDEGRALLLQLTESGLPDIIGGDLNTHMIPSVSDHTGTHHPSWFHEPQVHEPLFGILREYGYDWTAANIPAHTRRTLSNGFPKPPHARCDWILPRTGTTCSRPETVFALNSAGYPISDHDLVTTVVDGYQRR
ncbi:endonuclease/exonuclease/phosphatase family protein [Nocardia beijingensis]|uniref:endonuclease/exonuclease/phosphatase family protein n=1 Tax=Nocardia beijingensis TaxID=95162 RepID=UPI00344FBFA8